MRRHELLLLLPVGLQMHPPRGGPCSTFRGARMDLRGRSCRRRRGCVPWARPGCRTRRRSRLKKRLLGRGGTRPAGMGAQRAAGPVTKGQQQVPDRRGPQADARVFFPLSPHEGHKALPSTRRLQQVERRRCRRRCGPPRHARPLRGTLAPGPELARPLPCSLPEGDHPPHGRLQKMGRRRARRRHGGTRPVRHVPGPLSSGTMGGRHLRHSSRGVARAARRGASGLLPAPWGAGLPRRPFRRSLPRGWRGRRLSARRTRPDRRCPRGLLGDLRCRLALRPLCRHSARDRRGRGLATRRPRPTRGARGPQDVSPCRAAVLALPGAPGIAAWPAGASWQPGNRPRHRPPFLWAYADPRGPDAGGGGENSGESTADSTANKTCPASVAPRIPRAPLRAGMTRPKKLRTLQLLPPLTTAVVSSSTRYFRRRLNNTKTIAMHSFTYY